MSYTKEQIVELLETSTVAVERAILRIYSFQTPSEQHTKSTHRHNGRGFSSAHAEFMSSLAEWIKKSNRKPGQRLTSKQLVLGRKYIKKYWKQLMEFANNSEEVI